MNGWTKAWIAWGLAFVVIEGLAIKRGKPGERTTLSANLRWIVKRRRFTAWLAGGAFAAFVLWFFPHIWFND